MKKFVKKLKFESSYSTSRSDTIYALTTGNLVKSAVSMVRVSGPLSTEVFKKMTKNSKIPEARKSVLRRIVHPETKEPLDDSILVYYKSPSSFTGEDVVEIGLHGGRAVLTDVISALSSIQGFRMAEAGEFSKKAFLNGKMDITQAEGLADLIHAETSEQRKQALNQMNGKLSNVVAEWRKDLIFCMAHMTALVDFGDDYDINEDVFKNVMPKLHCMMNEINGILMDEKKGEQIRNGFQISLIGKPNSGKSSLLNLIAKRDVAIVSEIAGTTRDVVEIHLNLDGFPVILYDTAGIRESNDPIEKEGVKRALKKVEDSDLILLIKDANDKNDSYSEIDLGKKDVLHITNKIDLINQEENGNNEENYYKISCKESIGIDHLLNEITNQVKNKLTSEDVIITRSRHRECLNKCLENIELFEQFKLHVDVSIEYLREASYWLGKITGEIDLEEILDVVFSEFCIGK